MAWCLVKAQGQLYLYLNLKLWVVNHGVISIYDVETRYNEHTVWLPQF
jgi:hypothetical protein